MLAQNWSAPAQRVLFTPLVFGLSGSLPNSLHGLPSGTGSAQSATELRLIVAVGKPIRPANELLILWVIDTRSRVGVLSTFTDTTMVGSASS